MKSRTNSRQTMGRAPLLILAAALFALVGAADAATVDAENVVITRGATVDVPINISSAPLGDGITGVDVFLRYDSDLVSASAVVTAGTATAGWTIATNIVPDISGSLDEIRISAANSIALDVPTTGVLFYVTFTAENLTAGGSTPVTFELAELNESAVGATAGSITIGGYDGALTLAPLDIIPGDDINVTLVDADLEGVTGVVVTVSNPANGDEYDVPMTEDSGDPGTFTGTMTTEYDPAGAGGGTTGDAVLGVKAGASVTASYDDALNAIGGSGTVTTPSEDQVTVNGGDTADIVLTPEFGGGLTPGDDLLVQLTDDDLEGDPPFLFAVINQTTGDVVAVTMTQVGSSPAVFEGTVPTVYDGDDIPDNPADGNLGIKKDDKIVYTYIDPLGDDGGPVTVTNFGSELVVLGGDTGDVTLEPATLSPGDVLTVTLEDADLLGTGTATVTVSSDGGDFVVVTLTETPANSGIFTADIPTVYYDGTPPAPTGDGTLGIAKDDVVSYSYVDAKNDDGGPQTVVSAGDELTVLGGDTGDVTLTPTSLVPGDDLTVTLVDADLLGTGTATVTVLSNNGDLVVVTLTETPANSGIFTADIPTVYYDGTPPPPTGDGTLGIAEGDIVTWSYDDAKNDVGGPETVTTPGGGELVILGGTTGTIVASAAVQAGEGLRIKVTDTDLNTDEFVVETIDVTVTNQANSDVETVTLTEDGINSSDFKATPPFPTSSTDAAGVLWVGAEDGILIEYTDTSDDVGATVVISTTSTGILWGDTSTNGTIRALDAALILQNWVAPVPFFTPYQNLAGDVNPGTPYPELPVSDDATKILQYVVGLITSFPVEGSPLPHPYKPLAVNRRLALGAPLSQPMGVAVPLMVDEVDGILSGDLVVTYDAAMYRVGAVELTDGTSDFLLASNAVDGTLRIAFAGAQAQSEGPGALVTIQVEALSGAMGATPLHLEEVSLNGGQTAAEMLASAAAFMVPQSFSLQQNWPNPFNPETSLRYQLAAPGAVRLQVYDALGQVVRILVDDHQAAGSYSVSWDGLNTSGLRAATGVYFYSLEAGGAVQTRKMTLLR